jgi:ferredoxin-nitrate reductase
MGYADAKFIQNHTDNFQAYKEQVMATPLKKAAQFCGISVEEIKQAAQYIGQAKGFLSLWAMGLNQSVVGVDKNSALLNLSLVTGQIGKPGSGPFSLTGQPNAMGGREVGGMANLLAVHKDLANPEHRKQVADFWGVPAITEKPGLTATEMFEAIDTGKLKAIWIICTNPLVSLPNVKKVEQALKKAKFVVVQEISHKSDTVPFADVVFPAAGWLEKEGTMTNSERRISFLSKGINPPGEAKPDVEILCRFAQKMGFKGFSYASTEEIYREYALMTKDTNIDVSFLNYTRLQNEGTFQWPVPAYGHSGTPRLFTDNQFYTPSKKAQFCIPNFIENQSVAASEQYPLILTTGRIRDQWHTMTKTGKVSRLQTHYPKPIVELNPVDAYKYGIKDKDIVEVNSTSGQVRITVKLTDDVREGVVFMPMHWGKQLENDFNRANNLTSSLIDPISKEPDFKFTAVQVLKYQKPKQKIIVIGAGAAAFRWVQNYRDLNTTDTIHVFSKEPNPFYNRVLLPEYLTQELSWEQLQKIKASELEKLKITLYPSNDIRTINIANKQVTDSLGVTHAYDVLIMATGSRAFVPKDAQLNEPGRYTMRSKQDADNLRSHLEATQLPPEDQHIVIVGGGLLGLELAASLRHKKHQVTLIQRGARLMERQLDVVASRLLSQEIQRMGIQVYFNNEVSTVFNNEEVSNELEIRLKSGKVVQAHAIVYTIGTIPNIELAKKAGLLCGRGVKVNPYLQTSNPSVFAMGEIAEFNNMLYGITSAAEEQADSLASFLAGDVSSSYKGSVLMNILKLQEVSLCSIGQIEVPEDDNSFEEIIFTDISKSYYKKCIVKDDLLVGAILMGDKSEFAEFKALIEGRIELSDKRNVLLRGSSAAKPVLGKLVCSCSQVGAGNLEEAIRGGCKQFTDLCKQTGAGLGCGSCKSEVKELLKLHS